MRVPLRVAVKERLLLSIIVGAVLTGVVFVVILLLGIDLTGWPALVLMIAFITVTFLIFWHHLKE